MEQQPIDETQVMQNKVDRLKLLNLTSNIHSLTPPKDKNTPDENNVVLISALRVGPRLAEDLMMIEGKAIDPRTDKIVVITEPIMNIKGVWKLYMILKPLAEQTEWAAFAEAELPSRLTHYFEENLPYFTFWCEDYDLDQKNFNVIVNILQSYIDGAFHKSRHGKYINTVGRTYSEETMQKALGLDKNQTKDEGLFNKYNPFKGKK